MPPTEYLPIGKKTYPGAKPTTSTKEPGSDVGPGGLFTNVPGGADTTEAEGPGTDGGGFGFGGAGHSLDQGDSSDTDVDL